MIQIAASLCLVALAYLAHTHKREDLIARAVVPAIFCGAVVASKYNSGLLGVPFLIAALQARKALNVIALLGVTALSFIAAQPFALLEHRTFLRDLQAEMRHYNSGHHGYDGEPGLEQMAFYISELGRDVGWPLFACGVLGIRYGLMHARRGTLLLLAFPVLLLMYMSTLRVHFLRSVLPAYAVLAVFMGLGLTVCWDVMQRFIGQTQSIGGSIIAWKRVIVGGRTRRVLGTLALILIAMATLGPGHWASIRAAASPVSDSRVEVGRWLPGHARDRCVVLVPKQLTIDPRDLEPCSMEIVDPRTHGDAQRVRTMLTTKSVGEYYALRARFEDTRKGRQRTKGWDRLVRNNQPLITVGSEGQRLPAARRTRGVVNPWLALHRL